MLLDQKIGLNYTLNSCVMVSEVWFWNPLSSPLFLLFFSSGIQVGAYCVARPVGSCALEVLVFIVHRRIARRASPYAPFICPKSKS